MPTTLAVPSCSTVRPRPGLSTSRLGGLGDGFPGDYRILVLREVRQTRQADITSSNVRMPIVPIVLIVLIIQLRYYGLLDV